MDCEHTWRESGLWPNVLQCEACRALRDMAPQHHLYAVLMDPVGKCFQKIDMPIVEHVKKAWKMGVATTGSCQGGCYREPRAKIEFRKEHLPVMQSLAESLPAVEFVPAGPVVVMYFEAPGMCPMWEAEEELAKSGLTPRILAV